MFALIFLLLVGCAEPVPQKTTAAIEDTAIDWPIEQWCAEPVDSVFYTDVSNVMGLIDTTDNDRIRQEANPIGLADLDGDGLDDIILGQRRVGIWIQLNRGDSFETYLLSEVADVVGIAVADIEGDGDLDIWAGGYFDQMKLFANDGTGYFEDVSESSGIASIDVMPQKMDGVFGDIDNDGDLDLFVNMAASPQGSPESRMNKLLLNNGDGTFMDVSRWMPDAERLGLSWSSIWTDIDLDGDLDLYVANAEQGFYGGSYLFQNNGVDNNGWDYTDLSQSCFCTNNYNPMGVSSGDWNNDGLFDLFLTNTGANQLLVNEGNGSFVDVSLAVGDMLLPSQQHMTFGAAWFDYNNDGWQDVFVSSGPLHYGSSPAELEEQPDILLQSTGREFVNVATSLNLDRLGAGRGVAVGMLNDDGFLDIASANLGSPSFLYQANCTTARALVVELVGRPPNTYGVGARVIVETSEHTMHREITTKPGWAGAMHPRAHFGLGNGTVLNVTIYWPDGELQNIDVNPYIDGRIYVEQP